jgi:hypothetical protein
MDVTENGTGSPDYGAAETTITNSTKALSDGISKIIDAYTQKSSGS